MPLELVVEQRRMSHVADAMRDVAKLLRTQHVKLPWLGSISPATTRSSVLLPAPLSPRTT